jgi:hypothetical protein
MKRAGINGFTLGGSQKNIIVYVDGSIFGSIQHFLVGTPAI